MSYDLGQVRELVVTTPPALEPVSLDLAKEHLYISALTGQDNVISNHIRAARERLEAEVSRSFVARSYRLYLDGFPSRSGTGRSVERPSSQLGGAIRLPKPPLIAVQSVGYVDTNGTYQTLDASAYQVSPPGGKLAAVVAPAYNAYWPSARPQMGSVQVNYTAGYGDPSAVPATIVQAMLLLIGDLYENRCDSSDQLFPLPNGVARLMATVNWGSN